MSDSTTSLLSSSWFLLILLFRSNNLTVPTDNENKINDSVLSHPTPWNVTVRPTDTFSPYPGSLRDLYPRHPNTLEPYWWSSPGELNPKCREPLVKLLAEKDQNLIRKAAKERDANDPNKPPNIARLHSTGRNMFYKSDSVTEIPTKKLPKSAALQKTNDAAFCFTNNVDSVLFQAALNPAVFDIDASTCPSTASTDISQYMVGDTVDQRCYSVDIMTLNH